MATAAESVEGKEPVVLSLKGIQCPVLPADPADPANIPVKQPKGKTRRQRWGTKDRGEDGRNWKKINDAR